MERTNPTSIVLQQTLHGYRDGHRLLSGSISPPLEVRGVLHSLSDMSGPSMVPGFENYITGYPVADLDMYALASTWYAPEMERPGCVWTHTILIPFEAVPLLNDLKAVADRFSRPRSGDDHFQYSNPITLNDDCGREQETPSNLESSSLLSKLTAVVYEELFSSNEPVLVGADNAHAFFSLVIHLWNSQWPALRTNFKFCTGALSPRRLGGEDFDLQIFPTRQRSRFARVSKHATFVAPDEPSLALKREVWAQKLAEDGPSSSDLIAFIRELGPAFPSERKSFGAASALFDKIEDVNRGHLTVRELIRQTALQFPRLRIPRS
jgi:hypothetical protein